MQTSPKRATHVEKVFINCPFDSAYEWHMRAIMFAVFLCGFDPITASVNAHSSKDRLKRILGLIQETKISIHDLSRTGLEKASKTPRFNMPFELGFAYAASELQRKPRSLLALEKTKYLSKIYLSDLNGVDFEAHGDD
jgi:hypothetical protein